MNFDTTSQPSLVRITFKVYLLSHLKRYHKHPLWYLMQNDALSIWQDQFFLKK